MSPKRIYGSGYTVLVSPDRKYSLVQTGAPVPSGWKAVTQKDTKEAGLKYIKEVWTDMTAAEWDRLRRI